jgi:cell volume regulation protein A
VLRRAGVSNATRRLIAWFGPRGLSTLLLVLLAVFAGVPGAERLFAIACLVVLLSVVVHGGGIALLLRRRSETVPLPTQSGPRRASLPTLEPSSEAAEAPESQPIPDRITIDELRKLWARHAPVVLVDVRTDRTYRNEQLRARGAMRIPPDDVVRTARAMRLDHHATLVVYCA